MGMHEDFPAPSVYEHDDTPKAFRRLMQQKNQRKDYAANQTTQKPASINKDKKNTTITSSDSKAVRYGETFSEYNTRMIREKKNNNTSASDNKKVSNHPQHLQQHEDLQSKTQSATKTTSFAEASKSLRKKRKAHLKARDLKKKAQKSNNHADFEDSRNVSRARYIKDIVDAPPKLEIKPKKVFKRINENVNVPEWSEDDELEAGQEE